ncbi:DUF916 and DUF3324 domain-containing protein [Lacticaseibacillus porcinae]|uniref:DUF916 and DUF3324 domain-containing protein n=1 Tax=Lacticaseibacillus porcinae TaxID=1123687 RepID=UPI000F77FE43|nr:DUF916 and DUF3324 domain-containing protein [Lacticaseibacillus porcinae]
MKKWWLFIGLLFMFWPSHQVHAEGAGFTVTPQMTASQIGGDLGWFNLLVKPGVQEKLPVVVANQSNQTKTLRLQLTNAYTQRNGQIGYDPNTQKRINAQTSITAIGSKPVTVELAPKTGKTVTFTVTPPEFSGVVLGAIYAQDQTPAAQSSASGFAITNQFAMVVAVALQTSETKVPPQLTLASAAANTKQIVAHVQNPQPTLFGKLTLKSTVNFQGKAVLTQTDKDFAMAPNSDLAYQLTPQSTLQPGQYQLVIDATAGTAKWHLTKTFAIKKTVTPTVTPEKTATKPNYTWLFGLAIVLAMIIGIFIGKKRGGGRDV